MEPSAPAVEPHRLILRIAVPSRLYRTFDYLPPPGCDLATLQPGMRVQVSLGRQQVVGFLVELGTDTTFDLARLKPVQAVLDTEALLPPDVLYGQKQSAVVFLEFNLRDK